MIRYARPGSVIVFHDSVKASGNLLYALPRVLEYFGGKGYSFEAIKINHKELTKINHKGPQG